MWAGLSLPESLSISIRGQYRLRLKNNNNIIPIEMINSEGDVSLTAT